MEKKKPPVYNRRADRGGGVGKTGCIRGVLIYIVRVRKTILISDLSILLNYEIIQHFYRAKIAFCPPKNKYILRLTF